MPYPKDPNLVGLAAVTFINTIPPHELDHPATDLYEEDSAPLSSWQRWQAEHRDYRPILPPELLPTAKMPQSDIERE